MNEAGVTKGFDQTMWPAPFVPAGVPIATATRINNIVRDLVVTPEFLKFCEETVPTRA